MAKVKLVGDSETPEAFPVPVSVAGIGDTADANVTLSVAERLPLAEGMKLTLMVHELPRAIVVQVFVCEKSEGLAPAKVIAFTFRVLCPKLERVTGCGAVVVPTF